MGNIKPQHTKMIKELESANILHVIITYCVPVPIVIIYSLKMNRYYVSK